MAKHFLKHEIIYNCYYYYYNLMWNKLFKISCSCTCYRNKCFERFIISLQNVLTSKKIYAKIFIQFESRKIYSSYSERAHYTLKITTN